MRNFHPLEDVDRGSQAQLQVGENLDYINLDGNNFIVLFIKAVLLVMWELILIQRTF